MARWPPTSFLDNWAIERRRRQNRRQWRTQPDDALRDEYAWLRQTIQRLRESEHSIQVAEDHLYDRDVGAFLLGPNADWANRLRRIRYKLGRERGELTTSLSDLESAMFDRAAKSGVTLSRREWVERLHAEYE